MNKLVIGVVAALLLAGCSSTGGEDKFSQRYISSHVIADKTTQAEVQALYGVPDSQRSNSDGSSRWTYDKGGNLRTASGIAGYIPGAGAISSALGMTQSANDAADSASSASNKLTGNTEHHGDTLDIYFNKNKVVTSWSL
ncbi:hypothetical protein BTJ39_09700 [Izhakiella australiensis]|uniref:Lipoprotein SmpA/OmlA domain-containing protein n=1 Tax=Izhakiella australiensis TaxID=1926881 RepID=A0A1S8YM85_9GAMM|nr:hypothetical protein [Izhakiella australiensis]OON40160.1 hypothetical protein BTJ39_09700 [Izhakiella australiensis]